MKTIVFNGLINDNTEWSELCIGYKILTKELDFYGKFVNVRYFISDKPIINPVEQFIKYLYGDLDVDNTSTCGSSWTGQYGVDETLTIGGHDLLNELNSHLGKYCYLEITEREHETENPA